MFTFGDFNHELDYILNDKFKTSIFSARLLKNNKSISKVQPVPISKVSLKRWNNVSVLEKNKSTIKQFGIQNYENCCFLNASLQVMLNSSEFISSLNAYEHRSSGSSETIERILEYRKNAKESHVDIVVNKKDDSVTYYGDRVSIIPPCLSLITFLGFTRNQHEDAEEFLTKLLTQMHEDLLTCQFNVLELSSETKTDDEWVEIGKGGKNMSPPREDGGEMSSETVLSQLLAGKITEKVTKRGKTQNATVTPFFILPLNIQDQNIKDVESALNSLTRAEKLPDMSERQMQISQLPNLLTVQLKRFTFTKKVGIEKILDHVTINEQLTVPAECLHAMIKDDAPPHYRLYAVVFHIGEGVAKGHYTVALRHEVDGDSWIYIDDSNVMRVRGKRSVEWLLESAAADVPSQLLSLDLRTTAPRKSCVSGPRTPYLLFYTRL